MIENFFKRQQHYTGNVQAKQVTLEVAGIDSGKYIYST